MSDDGAADDDHVGTILKRRLEDFLRQRHPPKTFCPSEVARALTAEELQQLGYAQWRDAMPAVREIAWDLRQNGQCEILQKGQSIDDVDLDEVRGPIRIRRVGD
ncbi:hypothetical protein CKM354_000527600 [Cercospora kikuchii]|uniref:S-adenosylmethionine tRNA ribosyltransferase n=1 Tax=Cercospora kikuchii TaxID=84275 RepID=A0A9P3CLN8_9PEZI|nr:uncharacterized protein CKM354_000527600 [Cercospora kikuchii]GIZ41995.1 hypothetical protein CKM354_000527600 [Cercospora kikuchii]